VPAVIAAEQANVLRRGDWQGAELREAARVEHEGNADGGFD
jgi:hypothetical protein